jgi:Xaa-Pro aminopeptidase
MLNHIANGADMIIGRLRPPTPVLRAILQLPVEKRMAFLQIIAARLRLPSRRFSDLDNAARAVLWDMVQEFGLLPKTLRTIHWINVEKFLGAAGFNGSAGKHRSG